MFAWLAYSIYRQISQQSNLAQSWKLILDCFKGPQLGKLVLAIVLMPVNLGFEAYKWQYLIKPIQDISFWRAFKSVLSGQAVGLNTINRIGESAGRILFLEDGNRLRGVILWAVGGMSLVIVTYTLGVLFLLNLRLNILNETHHLEGLSLFWVDGLIYTIAIGISLFILFYFRLSWVVKIMEKIPFIAKHKFFVEKLEDFHWKELTTILLLSFSRYTVFVVQYVLLLQVFDVQVSFMEAVTMVAVMLLVLAVVPTISLAEIGLRGKVSLQLFGILSTNSIGIVATSAGIWVINMAVPAIAGTLFILGIRLFRNKSVDG